MTRHLLLLLLLFSTSFLVAQDLKLLTYNLADGIGDKRGNINNLQQHMKQFDVDVAAFQDIDGVSETALEEWAKKWQHPYVTILQSDAYALAITSKYPLENTKKIKAGMQHGYLYTEVAGIGIYTTQLTSENAKARQLEASKIAADVASNEHETIVLLGTLNSYSPQDSLLYNDRFRRVPKANRYDRDVIMRLASYQRKRNYEVLYQLRDVGLEDVLANQRGTDRLVEITHPISDEVPEYEQHRFDYILCNKTLAAQCEQIELLEMKRSQKISEHYPVMATFKLGTSSSKKDKKVGASR